MSYCELFLIGTSVDGRIKGISLKGADIKSLIEGETITLGLA